MVRSEQTLRTLRNSKLGILVSDVLPSSSPRDYRPTNSIGTKDPEQKSSKDQDLWRRRSRKRNQRWFCLLIIWYMLKQYQDIFDEGTMEQLLECMSVLDSFPNADNISGTIVIDDPYVYLVRWYHSHSLDQI